MTYLFLDDFRMSVEVGNYINPVDLRAMYRKEEWVIVRSFDEFVDWIIEMGMPDVISFDHDLADEHYAFSGNYNIFRYKTGYDCAKWLVEYCMDNKLSLPRFLIHSMNPVGSENIKSLLENFLKYSEK